MIRNGGMIRYLVYQDVDDTAAVCCNFCLLHCCLCMYTTAVRQEGKTIVFDTLHSYSYAVILHYITAVDDMRYHIPHPLD